MADVRLYCGPQRSARLAALDNLMREHWEEAIFLVPTRQIGARRTQRLILAGDLQGAWGRRVLTFEDFVRWLLESSHSDVQPIDEFERSMLLQDAVARVRAAGKLDALGPAADSAGFLSHMQRIVGQLKQAAVDPHEFRHRTASRSHPSPLDHVVADVYESYQDMLIEARLYDRQGLYWEAHEVCRRGRPEVLRNIRVLLLDGFDDFTPSEFRLLESLEQHLDLLVFGLNYDENPDRRDLYRLTAATAERIQARFSPRRVTFEPAPPETYTKFASAALFWRDKPSLPSNLRADLEVQPCPGLVAEVEHVGRRIKSLLIDGVPAEAIAIIYRDLEGVAGTVRGVFAEFGIPVRVVRRPCLSESAVCGFLLDALDAAEGWERETVVDVLTSPWFRPEEQSDVPHVDAIPSLARLAQIVAGYREWNDRLKALGNRFKDRSGVEDGGEDPERMDVDLITRYVRHMPQAPEAASALFARFDLFAQAAQTLRRHATVCEHLLALERFIAKCGVPEAIAAHPVAEVRNAERRALDTLRGLLTQIYSWCEADPDAAPVSRSDFVLRFRKALQEMPYDPADPSRGIECLDAEAARGLRFDHVFLCGANEGQFPKGALANAVYADEDIDELERAGIPLDGKRGRIDREALLFHRILDVPRRQLVITYRTLSPDGKAMRRAPFVEDLLELFPPDAGILKPPIAASAFVPAPSEIASWRDLRNAAFSEAPGLRALFRAELQGVDRGAQLERHRHDKSPFDAYDGVVSDEALRARLADRFGDRHVFSVSQIEAYAKCPFAYMVDRVLGILEIEPPAQEHDALLLGTVLHDVLQGFHHLYRDRAVVDIPAEEAAAAMAEVSEEVFRRHLRQNMNLPSGVALVVRRQVQAVLARYLRHCCKDGEHRWKPAHFEVTFGEERETFFDPLDRPDPIRIETPEGTLLFKGRIDRIDRDGPSVRVIDYKSGRLPTKASIKNGLSFQLPLYALAVEALLPDTHCEGAYFLKLGRDERVEGMDRSPNKDGWPERRTASLEAIAGIVRDIRNGAFPPVPNGDPCGSCAVCRTCRYEPNRVEQKRPEVNREPDE